MVSKEEVHIVPFHETGIRWKNASAHIYHTRSYHKKEEKKKKIDALAS